ncbi:transglutaminase family protein [Paenibacillus sp. SYP-B4298]|uniref:transglutaminase family protein n=1 Tax=Paenibacillus sp. SYP-B4298 TaxID=2996034 RepID=UPI0022DD06DA|nr:transglutaminase family protein [Paenibacillus sp. SYP-B4298]
MKLKIAHVTEYSYGHAVTDSVNEVRLSPCTDEKQSCYQHAIVVEPNASLFSYEDYFGNRVHAFSVNAPHTKLTIRTQMTVVTREVDKAERARRQSLGIKHWVWYESEEAHNRFAEYLLPTGYTTFTQEVEQLAGDWRGCGVYEWLAGLSSRIRSEFVYDPLATNVQTTVAEMVISRRGVCQDFAHLMISVCRHIGVPARYVSGYHFIGDLQGGSTDFQHASHAWVEAYVAGAGWCSFDPTNEAPVGERYVKLGHGRDYKDIVPVKGLYRGTGVQQLHVTVDVQRLKE